jgi:hypothetical protein
MSPFAAPLPIDDVLGALRLALAEHSSAVLVAPPGAGKTTRAASPPLAGPQLISAPLLYVNIGAMPGSAFAIARRYAGRCPMRSR